MPTKPQKIRPITLEELMALNDEIVALVRAGVPLEMGLQELGEDRAGQLGRLAARLAGRLNQGESLAEALGREDMGLPRSYRAIVEAGLRSGRLTAALEGVSRSAWKMLELRRRIGLALVYPLIVLMLAYGMFLLLCTQAAPRMLGTFEGLGARTDFFEWLSEIGRNAHFWGWVPPAVVVALILWWRRSGDSGLLSSDGRISGIASLCPGIGKITKYYRYSQFADLLALLIEQEVPLQEAIVLAAETTNDQTMQDSARAIAEATSRGQVSLLGFPAGTGFPPFLYWLITRREEQAGIVSALRAAADMYRRKAVVVTEWIKIAFPVAAAVFIGGGATLIYTLTIFWPLTELLKDLARPVI